MALTPLVPTPPTPVVEVDEFGKLPTALAVGDQVGHRIIKDGGYWTSINGLTLNVVPGNGRWVNLTGHVVRFGHEDDFSYFETADGRNPPYTASAYRLDDEPFTLWVTRYVERDYLDPSSDYQICLTRKV